MTPCPLPQYRMPAPPAMLLVPCWSNATPDVVQLKKKQSSTVKSPPRCQLPAVTAESRQWLIRTPRRRPPSRNSRAPTVDDDGHSMMVCALPAPMIETTGNESDSAEYSPAAIRIASPSTSERFRATHERDWHASLQDEPHSRSSVPLAESTKMLLELEPPWTNTTNTTNKLLTHQQAPICSTSRPLEWA